MKTTNKQKKKGGKTYNVFFSSHHIINTLIKTCKPEDVVLLITREDVADAIIQGDVAGAIIQEDVVAAGAIQEDVVMAEAAAAECVIINTEAVHHVVEEDIKVVGSGLF